MEIKSKIDFYTRFGQVKTPGMTKYAQLRLALLNAIESGYWAPGDKLPTEIELTEVIPFGQGTVQRALNELTREGIIVASAGPWVFRLAHPRKAMTQQWRCRFLTIPALVSCRFSQRSPFKASENEYGPWSSFLDQAGGNIIRIDRRISINTGCRTFTANFTRTPINSEAFLINLCRNSKAIT